MESDEDETFLVVVGDDTDKSFPTCIKSENEDYPISECSIEYLEDEDSKMWIEASIKNEPDDEENNLLEKLPKKPESDENSLLEELPKKPESDEEYSPDGAELSEDDVRVPTTKRVLRKRNRKLAPAERHSYVQSIKNRYPELRKDEKLLVDSLVAIMKETKPPPPPGEYYVMNGAKLKCVECGHQSVSMPAASRHYQEKHGKRYLYCLACGVNFRSKTNLYKHEKMCDAPDALTVLRARALFLGHKGRSRPFADEAKAKPKTYDCTECSASFKSNYSLKAHAHSHAGVRPYVCAVCGRGYTCSITLTRHVRRHDAAERFVCDLCRRSFATRATLVVHLDTHQPLKRFACAECDKRFAQRAALVRHVDRQHRGLPPPCACQMCPKRYPRMSVLKEHMRKEHGMLLMTRNMYFKALPTLGEPRAHPALLVMKSAVDAEPAPVETEPINFSAHMA